MLSPKRPSAVFVYNFGKRYEVDAICCRSFFLASFVAVLTLLPQQPAVGQQPAIATGDVMIESITQYSFSTPYSNEEHTGSSRVVLINRLDPEADASNPSGQSSPLGQSANVVNAAETVEPETVIERSVLSTDN